MSIVRARIVVVCLLASCFAVLGCAADAPPPVPEGTRTTFARAAGYAVSSEDGSVDVTLVSRKGEQVATGRWDAATRSLEWSFGDDGDGSLTFERFTPTEEGVAAIVYSRWNASDPEAAVTCDPDDGTCTTQQALACELNCMYWTGDSYGSCWCGCNPSGRSCSYGCCL